MLKHARGRASRAATRDPAFVSPTGRPTLASLDVLTGGQRPGQRVAELIDFRHVQLVRQRQYQRRTDALSRACMRSARAARLKLCRLHRTCAARTRGLGYVPIVRRALDKGSIVRSEGRWGILTTMPRRAPPSRVVIAASRSGAGSETPLSSDRSKDSSKLSQPRRLSTIRAEGSNVSATRSVPDFVRCAGASSAKIFTKAVPRCGTGVRQLRRRKKRAARQYQDLSRTAGGHGCRRYTERPGRQ